jgi:hypothetical protein
MRSTLTGLLAIVFMASANAPLFAQQQWGDVKAKVVWAEDKIPDRKVVNNKGCPCARPVEDNILLINAKNKGVANVAICLVPMKGAKMPIHPKLAAVPKKAAIIDQPACLFEPRVTMIRAGQRLEIRNSSAIGHNANLAGGVNQPPNVLIPAGGKLVFDGQTALKPENNAISMSCSIHAWMGGQIYVFDHPYFTLTDANGNFEIKDAPAGNYLIYMKHESCGWLHTPRLTNSEKKSGGRFGQPISIPAGKALDMGVIKFKPAYLN